MYLSLSLWWVGEVEVCNSNSFIVLPQYWLVQDFQAVCRITCDWSAQYHIRGGGGGEGT